MNGLDLGRVSGQSTRQIDAYVQELFANPNEWVYPKDHHGMKRLYDIGLCKRIARRLDFEHPNVKYEAKEDKIRVVI